MTCLRGRLPTRCFLLATILIGAIFFSIGADTAVTAALPAESTSFSPFIGNEKVSLVSGAFNVSGPTHRQDFCNRYREMINLVPGGENVNVRNALEGSQLKVSLVPGPYFIYDDINGIDPDFPGVHALLLDYIAEQGNFTWRDSFAVWTREEKGNRSITELLQWGVERYDVMIGTYTPSTARINLGISFVDGHFDGSLIMARNIKPTKAKVNYTNFFKPFQAGVWMVIVGVIIFSALTYQFLEYLGGAVTRNDEKSFRRWFMDNLYLSSINFTGNYSYEPTTLGGRVFGFFFAFWAMLITAAYTANLASLLVVTNISDPKINTVLDAVDLRYKICVHATSYSEEYLMDSFPEVIPYLVPKDKDVLYDALNNGECEIMVAYKQEFDTNQMRAEYNPSCNLDWQGRKIKPLTDAFATKFDPGVKCTDLVNEVLNYYMKEMEDNGFLQDVWNKHNDYYGTPGHCQSASEQQSNRNRSRRYLKASGAVGGAVAASSGNGPTTQDEEPEFGPLSLHEMAGTMMWQVVGSLVAIVVALVSGFEPKTNAKRKIKKCVHRPGGGGGETIVTDDDLTVDNDAGSSNDDDLHKQLGDVSRQLAVMNETIYKMQEALDRRNIHSHRYRNAIATNDIDIDMDENGKMVKRYEISELKFGSGLH